jgi:hypothetical protein
VLNYDAPSVPTGLLINNCNYFNKLKISPCIAFGQNVSDSGHAGSKIFTDILAVSYLIDFSIIKNILLRITSFPPFKNLNRHLTHMWQLASSCQSSVHPVGYFPAAVVLFMTTPVICKSKLTMIL